MKRRKTGAALAIAGLLIAVGVVSGGYVIGQAIPGQVSVKSLAVVGSVTSGRPVTLMLRLKDDDSQIRSVMGTVTSPDGVEKLNVIFHAQKNAWRFVATFMLPNGALPGNWTVGDLQAMSDIGETVALTDTATLTVPEAGAKTTAHSVQVPKGQFRETQILPVTVTPAAGLTVQSVTVTLVGPNHQVLPQTMIFASALSGGTLEIPVRLTKGLGAGSWKIARVSVTEADGTVHQLVAGKDFDGNLNIVKGRQDSLPPTVTGATLSANGVTTGQTVKVHADVEDDVAGVGTVMATLIDTTGRQQGTQMLSQDDSGQWSGVFQLPTYAPSGEWKVQLQAADSVGNRMTEAYTVPLQVTAGYTEANAPTVSAVSLDYTGGILKPLVRLTGDVPARSVLVRLEPPNANGRRLTVPLDEVGDGVWTRNLPLPENVATGDWKVTGVDVLDALGNQGAVAAGDLPSGHLSARAEVAASDSEAPVLDEVKLTGTLRSGKRAQVTVSAHDRLTGVESVQVALKGSDDLVQMAILHLDESTGRWIGTVVLPAAGTWRVESVTLSDAAWNNATLTSGLGFDATVTVR